MMNRTRLFTAIFGLLTLLLSIGCASKPKPEVTTQQIVLYNDISKQADDLYDRGCYVSLKQAYELYEKAVTIPVFQQKTTEKLLKTAILLGLRERELGILQETYFPKAEKIVSNNPYFGDYAILLKAASAIPRKTVGVVGDLVEDGDRVIVSLDDVKANLKQWTSLLEEKSVIEEIYAYVAISFFQTFSYFIKEELDIDSIEKAFPNSPLMWYMLAHQPWGNPLVLEKLLLDDPQFYEAYFFLGQKAMERRMFVTAEKKFLKAYPEIPLSSSLVISLASIYFAFEELEQSLEFYEKTLEMAPFHRDALLGKSMCLSYLGRHEEAIEVCNAILSLGKYYLGESHYWRAWNLNELEQWEEAWENVETAKKYLIGHADVFFLSGQIAFHQNRLDISEQNLRESNKLDASNGDSFYYLGKIKNLQKDWLNAGAYFDSASSRYEIEEKDIQDKMKAIMESEFSEERKKKHLTRKTIQLKKMKLTKATSWYNAAAGFYNAGFPEKASQLAEKAASHPGFKQKAEELLKLTKK
jgi:tetratricopeptide (TPR) repeat protein